MRANNHIETLNPLQGNFQEKSFGIKLGEMTFEISERQIAYTYKCNHTAFLVSKYGLTLPIRPIDLNEMALNLNDQKFFKLYDGSAFSRDSMELLEHSSQYYVMAYNANIKNIFRIPKYLEIEFLEWLSL